MEANNAYVPWDRLFESGDLTSILTPDMRPSLSKCSRALGSFNSERI